MFIPQSLFKQSQPVHMLLCVWFVCIVCLMISLITCLAGCFHMGWVWQTINMVTGHTINIVLYKHTSNTLTHHGHTINIVLYTHTTHTQTHIRTHKVRTVGSCSYSCEEVYWAGISDWLETLFWIIKMELKKSRQSSTHFQDMFHVDHRQDERREGRTEIRRNNSSHPKQEAPSPKDKSKEYQTNTRRRELEKKTLRELKQPSNDNRNT